MDKFNKPDVLSELLGDFCIVMDETGKNVLFVKDNDIFNYVVVDEDNGTTYFLCSERDGENQVAAASIDLDRLVVIPEINSIEDARCEQSVTNLSTGKRKEYSSKIFLITSYGILENEQYKGCLLSNSRIRIQVANADDEVYTLVFRVADDVKSCDGNPRGQIEGKFYKFAPYAKVKNGKIVEE